MNTHQETAKWPSIQQLTISEFLYGRIVGNTRGDRWGIEKCWTEKIEVDVQAGGSAYLGLKAKYLPKSNLKIFNLFLNACINHLSSMKENLGMVMTVLTY